jgi:hypothetical protein
MTMKNEMNEEFDREWQPGPVVEINWWGREHSDIDEAEFDFEDDDADIDL